MNSKHNHITRGMMKKGECPACDESMAKSAARKVLEHHLYELNVEPDETEAEANKILEHLKDVGLTFTWIKD